MEIGDVEIPLEFLYDVPDLRSFRALNLDGKLINLIECRFRDLQERVPLRSFDIHFDDEVTAGVAVSREL